MAIEFFTPSNITFILGIIGIIITVWRSVKEPQFKSEKVDALLEQKVKFSNLTTEQRFSEINKKFESLQVSNNNHLHTVETKVDALNCTVVELGKDVVRVQTLLEERLPKK